MAIPTNGSSKSVRNNYYLNNPLIHTDRRLSQSGSEWVRSFSCYDVKPLIICRGPIRKEAMDVFEEMGIHGYGILLSEKDSIIYTNALAPELRKLTDPDRIHRVPDYTGASKEERAQRIRQIVQIAKDNGYNAIFAGYGFMAEDEEMVFAMEQAGLNFIGPCSKTVHAAGLKDEAKRTALAIGVSVTPGINDVSARTLLNKYPDTRALQALVAEKQLAVDESVWDLELAEQADAVLNASFEKHIDLFSINELGAQVVSCVSEMYRDYPQNRIRLKAISGGGGKGQRILPAPSSYKGKTLEARIEAASSKAPEMVREILAEVKCNGVGDNKNILIELNIETTRHQEIQVLGNGDWCITLGGRDCSLQMHEQKLLEVSCTQETLKAEIKTTLNRGEDVAAGVLQQDLKILQAMEEQAARFGQAVGLDSVSTFECIVERDRHFFMEMNTRIQVEHRVTELCYTLKFTNPDNANDHFMVESLVEAMVLLARHGARLPKPERIPREAASVEARLNATNEALRPHAGGIIKRWSDPVKGEIRDDQGISLHNPDTNVFMYYRLAGAYDSNIALLLTVGKSRLSSFKKLAEILRVTRITGSDLATNLHFHYGLVNWFIGHNANARPTTRFIVPYLTAVGALKAACNQLDIGYAFQVLGKQLSAACSSAEQRQATEEVIARKATLIVRPIQLLFEKPHVLAGWLSLSRSKYEWQGDHIKWLVNPLTQLKDLYHFLNMDYKRRVPPADMIWDHDNELLQKGTAFYEVLESRLSCSDYPLLCERLQQQQAPQGFSSAEWNAALAAHQGFQAGLELLAVLPYIARLTDFYSLKVNKDLSIEIPAALQDADYQEAMAKVLVPPPVAKSDEILAESGGMFYPREAPGMEVFIKEGQHFNEGDPLYVVEVMKMFNKVYAPFAGTVNKILAEGEGVIITKGQTLFKVTPDEIVVVEAPEKIAARRRQQTDLFLQSVFTA